MATPFTLGRVFGINVTIDISWIVIFLLMIWNLGFLLFPALHPEWTRGFSVILGLIGSLLFFTSILAHEFAHALMAKARGMDVRSITLFLFGGVSNLEQEPSSPATEFLVTIVGPLTSLLLGFLLLGLGWISSGATFVSATQTVTLQQLSPVATLLLWLGSVNVAIGVFNLIPGFPLDGGRILRSVLWWGLKSLRKATWVAARVGQVIAWAFMICGVLMAIGVQVPLFGTGLLGGLWLVVIGWFLNRLAVTSDAQVAIDEALKQIPVSRIMRSQVIPVPASIPISELVNVYLLGTREHTFPVVQDSAIVGLVHTEDVRKQPQDAWDKTPIDRIMTPAAKLDIAVPHEMATDALRRLSRSGHAELLIVQDERVVGIFGLEDVISWLQIHAQDTDVRALRLKTFWFQRSPQ